jgi:hypothetical protein
LEEEETCHIGRAKQMMMMMMSFEAIYSFRGTPIGEEQNLRPCILFLSYDMHPPPLLFWVSPMVKKMIL